MRSMNKNIKKTFDLFENLYMGDSDGFKVFSGYPNIDNQISGLNCGDLVAIVGDSGSGKTAFLSNVALNVADESTKAVLFYSLQYPAVQLVLRMICIKGKVSHHQIIRGYIKNENWHKMTSAASKLLEAPLLIEDSTVDLNDHMFKKMRLRRQKLTDLRLIIIDSIDMLAGSGIVQYYECLRKLKAAAVDMRIPILFSAFIRKENKKNKRKSAFCQERLQAIETYADTIMHISSDSGILLARYNDTEGDINREHLLPYIPEIYMAVKTELAMIKNTYGSKESVFLTFIPQQFRFESDERAG